MRATNVIPLGCSLLLPVGTVNCVQTLKGVVVSTNITSTSRTDPNTGVSLAAVQVVADFDPTFLAFNSSFFVYCNQSIKVAFWDQQSKTLLRNNSEPAAINLFLRGTTHISKTRYMIEFTGNLNTAALPSGSGDGVTVMPRGGSHSLQLLNCTQITVTDVGIYGGASMGIVESGGGGGNTYLRVLMTRRPLPDGTFRHLAINVRCAFFDRSLHSRMPLVPTPARLKRAGV
jgi:hypothetical protein